MTKRELAARLEAEREKSARLERELLVMQEDMEAGLTSPRALYIRLLCRCFYMVAAAWRDTGEGMPALLEILDRIGRIEGDEKNGVSAPPAP